uniref:Uncharacterized protein n=1 Tax=Meloidogyne incognita TaxID=6306 RepID=A0A914L770_MELIC
MSNIVDNNSGEAETSQCSIHDAGDGADLTSFSTHKISGKEDESAPEPKKLRNDPTLKYEQVYLRAIPKASQYEKSFMHRDTITHVLATEKDFIITASQDGHLKFWKKKHNEGIEFVKHFRCHLSIFFYFLISLRIPLKNYGF